MLYDEAILIEERESSRISTEATLRQSLLGSIFAKKGSKAKSGFSKDTKRISVRTKPRRSAFE